MYDINKKYDAAKKEQTRNLDENRSLFPYKWREIAPISKGYVRYIILVIT